MLQISGVIGATRHGRVSTSGDYGFTAAMEAQCVFAVEGGGSKFVKDVKPGDTLVNVTGDIPRNLEFIQGSDDLLINTSAATGEPDRRKPEKDEQIFIFSRVVQGTILKAKVAENQDIYDIQIDNSGFFERYKYLVTDMVNVAKTFITCPHPFLHLVSLLSAHPPPKAVFDVGLYRGSMGFNLRFAVAAELVELDQEGYKALEEIINIPSDCNRDDDFVRGLEPFRPPYSGLNTGTFSVVTLPREGWMEQNIADINDDKSVHEIKTGDTWTIYVTPAGMTYKCVPTERRIAVVGREFLYPDGILAVVDDKTPLQSLVKALTLCNAYKHKRNFRPGCIIV